MVFADCRASHSQPGLTVNLPGNPPENQAKIVKGFLKLFLYICCSPKG